MKIVIKGFIESSLLDWDGKIVSTLYVPYCNMRCPFCHNRDLILNPDKYPTFELAYLKEHFLKKKEFIDGICLTGGEPCLYEDLVDFLKEFKSLGAEVKLDTNGTFPGKIKEAYESKVIDYVAMDIKAPLEFEAYKKASGLNNQNLFNGVKESIKYIMSCGIDYEFRTTVVPTLHTKEDILRIADFIKGARKYALQNFQAENTLDESFSQLEPYKREDIQNMAEAVKDNIEKVEVRGR